MKKLKRIASFVLAVGMAISSVSAYEFTEIRTEPTEKTIVLEAEDFVRGGGFSIVSDPEASGGKCIVGSGDQTKSIEFDLEFENPADVLVVYGTHKAVQKNGNLSYIAINHFENYSFYDYEIGKWNDTRIYLGSAPEGKYTIKLTSVRAGQKIDKITIKYDEGEKKELKPTAINESQTYVPAKPEAESLNIAEAVEKSPGSFFFDVEDGISSDKAIVAEDEDAFGGKYWYVPHDKKYPHLTDVYMTDEIYARFKFNVSRKGNYVLWVRYSTPERTRKTTWFGIDNENYYRLEDNKVQGWVWKKGTTFYIDEGWHTLDIKYRQPGQFIDCAILTDISGFNVVGKGSLPGEDIVYGAKQLADIAETNSTSKFKINNMRTRSDCQFTHQNGDILVPATNLFNMMACDFKEYDGYCVATQGRNHLKFYKDSRRIVANGKAMDIEATSFYYDGAIPMVSIKAVKKAFGIDYEYDETQSILHVFYDFDEPEYREAKEGEIEVTPGQWSFRYRIPCDDPNAKVRVWHKCDIGEASQYSRMDYDDMNNLSEHRVTLKRASGSSQQWDYWIEAPPPSYVDGAFVGADTTPQHGTQHFKVQITRSNGVTDTFIKHKAVHTIHGSGRDGNLPPDEYAPNTGGELYLVPTFESISYYIDVTSEATECTVYYRKKGDSEWRKAYTPTYDSVSLQYRGSIVYCSEDTEYEVKAVLTGPNAGEKLAETKTWTSNVPIGRTIGLSEIYSGEGPLSLIDLKGTADSWIKIVPDEKCDTINGTKNFYQALMMYDCEYVILEGLKVRGGRTNCINLQGSCKDIRIINCDIAGWGNEGIQDPNTGGFYWRGVKANYYAGIYLSETTNAVVERCYIHDSDTRSNAWYGATYSNIHPAGSTAICLGAAQKGTVIRYNDCIGSDKHRFNDVMEGKNNNGREWGSTGSDSDIYGNMMAFSQDDAIELDGGQMNVRFYNNRIENTYVGISTAPNRMGPSYMFNNLLINMGSSYLHQAGTGFKAGGGYEGGIIGMLYFFNNAVHTSGAPLANINYSGSREYHSVTRNNIFVREGSTSNVISNTFANELDDNDYDMIAGTFNMKDGDESHAVVGTPIYNNYEEGDVHLTAESPGVGAGQYIDNFAEYENPNMGVYPSSDYDKKHMPYRPIDMYVDTPIKQVVDLEEREITVHVGDIGEGHTYSIIKNEDYEWLEITSEAGMKDIPLKPNTDITFKIKGDLSKCEFEVGRATILFRLENGFSVPISVNCTAPVVVVEEE